MFENKQESPDNKNSHKSEHSENETSVKPSYHIAMYALPDEQSPTREEAEVYEKTKKEILDNIPELIKKSLLKNNIRAAFEIADLLFPIPKNQEGALYPLLCDLINRGFESTDSTVWLPLAKLVSRIPESVYPELHQALPLSITELLEQGNLHEQNLAAQMILYTDKSSQKQLQELLIPIIQNKFKSKDKIYRMVALLMVIHNPDIELPLPILIKDGLKDAKTGVRQNAACLIEFAPEETRSGFILTALKDPEQVVLNNAVALIQYAPQKMRAELIRAAWKNKNIKREKIAEIIYSAPKDAREKLWEQWHADQKKPEESELQALAQSTPLYKNAPVKFGRHDFPKTGSRITLLSDISGESKTNLEEKIIIRHITASAYVNWIRAFENNAFWKTRGFTYVPVEPIIRTRMDAKTGQIAVFTRILGPSVASWQAKTGLFRKEIEEQIDHINSGLIDSGIKHGHEHMGNFCLAFYRTPDGAVNLEKPPRVYVIDFDRASSSLTS